MYRAGQCHADGELDNAEYHSRLETATKAKTRGDLHAVLGDLQVPHPLTDLPAEPIPAPRSGSAGRGLHHVGREASRTAPAPQPHRARLARTTHRTMPHYYSISPPDTTKRTATTRIRPQPR
ncbi:DUF1707 SHOCT-like domain-containing protein [Nocardia sp. GAS34]|uniref:DUF1707 SHOCT-like domain-containing protein n=1 Tax=unclassified Nocardia TaxID=2637762 RepID=UPI003D1C47B4